MQSVVYTNKNDCQDCYKCVRNCPVEAISMINNSASIDETRCIMCGKCIKVCPVGAQRYRNDEDRVKQLLRSGKRVLLSLAPSFTGEFDITPEDLIRQIKQVGFYGVSETALGAQLVTYFQRKQLENHSGAMFSTACPTFVHLVMKYFPDLKNHLSPFLSPLLAGCTMLKKLYGDDIAVVFAGPCIAKKSEADLHPELLDVSITFDELKNIIKTSEIIKESDTTGILDGFIPLQSNGGAIYPLDGGMVETITELKPLSVTDTSYFHYSGIEDINGILLNEDFSSGSTFYEFLACSGGCINGSGLFDQERIVSKKNKVADYYKNLKKYPEEIFIKRYAPDSIKTEYTFCGPVLNKEYTFHDKEKIWLKLGKYKEEDFLNCGGCGYDTCDNFAVACLDKRAELQMCVVCMKKQAQNKIRSFMKATPLGLCVVDDHCNIIECNCKFLELSIETDIKVDEELTQRVVGKGIDKFFEVSEMVRSVHISKEQKTKIIHKDGRIFDILAFSFDGNRYSGLIIQDITRPTMKRDVVINNAQEVIKNNLLTVQKIAFLLGETAAETEITLNRIIDAFNTRGND